MSMMYAARETHAFRADLGDRVVLEGPRGSHARRTGTVTQILGSPGTELYRVRWEDGHETLVGREVEFLVVAENEPPEEPPDEPVLMHEP